MIKFENPWLIKVQGEQLVLKFTQQALDELGQLIFLDLPNTGAQLVQGMPCIGIEATNWIGTSKIPLSGEVISVNDKVAGLNSRLLTSHDWLLKLKD
ncbi:hypothetical protein [uncultured Limosilactobacillus sp.]|uniref:hypothetical protein n=1 Tax=uncultured Limosilactobacillus sp. TaxID=2837629 RepID=UPI0025EE650A|nr:hypothetical protein [uncultured Limosilactobacillus sp.]